MWRLLGFISICTVAGLAQDAPVFRTQTRLVRVPVIATRDGQPVRDLKAEDFKVLDNGKERPIAMFSLEEQRAVAGSPSPATKNAFSNRLEEQQSTPAGVTLMVLAGIPTQARVELLEFIRDLKKDDHFGIYAFWDGYINVLHDYSTDCSPLLARAATIDSKEAFDLKTLIDKLFPNRAKTGAPLIRFHEGISEVEDAYLINFRGLKAIARHVAAIPGRKNLIWIGPGFSTNYGKMALNRAGALVRSGNFMVEEAFAAFDALNRANVAIYAVDPRGLMTADGFTASQRLAQDSRAAEFFNKLATDRVNEPLEGLQEMAQQTGGRVYANRNDIRVALRQAADDGRISYELGFYPPEKDWDGRQHKLEVKSIRSGISLVHREGYSAADVDNERGWKDAALDPYDATALPFNIEVRPAGGNQYALTLRVPVESLGLISKDGRWTGTLDMLFAQRGDAEIENNRNDSYTIEINLKPETYSKAAESGGISYEKMVTRIPKASDVRVVLRAGGTQRIGSVTVPFDKIQQ